MDVHAVIRSQHHAALDMLQAAIEGCPEAVWDREEDGNRSWQVAYHAIFYTHFYLHAKEADFVPWEGHRENLQIFGDRLPWPPHDEIDHGEPLTKAEVLDYLAHCRAQVDAIVPGLDLHAESGFAWLPMSKLEHMLYNLRHLMQHTGELYERLAKTGGPELPWVGMGPSQ